MRRMVGDFELNLGVAMMIAAGYQCEKNDYGCVMFCIFGMEDQ